MIFKYQWSRGVIKNNKWKFKMKIIDDTNEVIVKK